mgnify:CR=1 FL=1
MKLSVVILNYNVCQFLEQCIISVQRAIKGLDAEIIIIDNASSDGSCAMVREKFPRISLIENKDNVGFSRANNQAVAVATGEYVCILNPDTAVAEDTFIEALKRAEAIPNLGALGCYLMDGTGQFLPESKRNLPTPKRSVLKLLGRTKGKSGYYARHLEPEQVGEVEILVGAFMLLKRGVYKQVGGFDEDYFMYGEDIDLSYKLMQAGYQNWYDGSITVLHYKGESTKKDAAYLKRFYGAMRIFYGKHFNSNLLLNWMVNNGVRLASWKRKRQVRRSRPKAKPAEQVLVVTDRFSLLGPLKKHFDIPIQATPKSELEDRPTEDGLILFDVAYISYRQIFSVMKKLKNRGNRFRIIPPGCTFIVGSDQSDHKGEVKTFN